ncbi:MAG: ribonuclease HII [Deltaproteobacteria bacterium]|nr:ribonuclease HII [Candidatus Tharpella aukensis]
MSDSTKAALVDLMTRLGRPVVVGVDEVGRGCLAGPVVAAAVLLNPGFSLPGIDDSKTLSPGQRDLIFAQLANAGVSFGLGVVSAREVDRINILQASLKAMVKALTALRQVFDLVVVDGRQRLPLHLPQYPLIRGDSLCLPVAVASIIAKVVRDRQMLYYNSRFPEYGFARHKGYGTVVHRRALSRYGPCALHRRTFRYKIVDGDG